MSHIWHWMAKVSFNEWKLKWKSQFEWALWRWNLKWVRQWAFWSFSLAASMRWTTQYMLSLFEERRTQRFSEWVMTIWSIMKTTIMRNRLCQTQSPVPHLTNACMEGNVQRLLKQGFWRRRKNFNMMKTKTMRKACMCQTQSPVPLLTHFSTALLSNSDNAQ